MPLIVPHEGDVQLLTDLLCDGEDWRLGLFHADVTPSERDTASLYLAIEATFAGYTRRTLSRRIGDGGWSPPIAREPSGKPAWSSRVLVGHSEQPKQTWTCCGVGDTIYGYFIMGAVSGNLICAERFEVPCTLAAGETLSITPVFENA